MTTKVCRICCQEKSLDLFHVRKDSPDGYRTECKDCLREQGRMRRKNDPEKYRERDKKRYIKDKDKRKACATGYRKRNREKIATKKKSDRENNRGMHRAQRARRRAAKRQATPFWADKSKINLIYVKARRLEVWLDLEYHVDHIVPLQSDLVCGLHCEANLQILPAFDNISKKNFYWPDMW